MDSDLFKTGSCSIILGKNLYKNYFPVKENKLLKVTKILKNHNEFPNLKLLERLIITKNISPFQMKNLHYYNHRIISINFWKKCVKMNLLEYLMVIYTVFTSIPLETKNY